MDAYTDAVRLYLWSVARQVQRVAAWAQLAFLSFIGYSAWKQGQPSSVLLIVGVLFIRDLTVFCVLSPERLTRLSGIRLWIANFLIDAVAFLLIVPRLSPGFVHQNTGIAGIGMPYALVFTLSRKSRLAYLGLAVPILLALALRLISAETQAWTGTCLLVAIIAVGVLLARWVFVWGVGRQERVVLVRAAQAESARATLGMLLNSEYLLATGPDLAPPNPELPLDAALDWVHGRLEQQGRLPDFSLQRSGRAVKTDLERTERLLDVLTRASSYGSLVTISTLVFHSGRHALAIAKAGLSDKELAGQEFVPSADGRHVLFYVKGDAG